MDTKTKETIKKLFESNHSREYIIAAAWGMRDNNTSMADILDEINSAELAALRAENAELREALEAITERAEDVSDRIVVEKRNPGVSQASHVRHMASHLAQHAKKARAILAKREWSADDILKREG